MAGNTRTHDESLGIAAAGEDESHGPDVARVQALLESRMLGTPLVSTKIGRFVVLDRIGAGAMGVVYSAYDGQLDRRVALKLLHARRDADELARRLVREAQAMARLSHPNVVTIHDVGEHAERLYLAMELVDGVTLRRWLQADARTWREIVAVFAQAGRGLAAAHEAGLVHRDFKPDNLLVDHAGKVKVADFGLAHTGIGEPSGREASASSSADASSDRLTRSGAIVGTPAYMSPEQAGGEDPGPADDQFSFCVALYEALYGVRPFAGTRLVELIANIRTGTFAETPRGDAVPTHIRAIVRRGLAFRRAQRWPSMTALVEALERDPTRGRRRRVAAASVLGIAVLAFGVNAWQHHRIVERCDEAGDPARSAWHDEARERTRHAFASAEVSFAAETWQRAALRLDEAVDDLASTQVSACHATDVRKELDTEDAIAVRDCLAEQDARIAGLVEIWAAPERRTIEQAVSAATRLPRASSCLDRDWLRDRPAPPSHEDQRTKVQEIRLVLAESSSLTLAGHVADAAALTRDALSLADAADYEPVRAEALSRLGQLESDLGDPVAAMSSLRAAYTAATRSRHDREAGEAALRLVFAATNAGKPEIADEWAAIADAVLERSGRAETASAAALLAFRATLALRRSRLDEADRLFAEAEALLSRVEPDPLGLARAAILENWGLADVARGDHDAAERHHREAYEIKLERLGAAHPDVGGSLNNLGIVQVERGDFATGAQLYEQAIAVVERANGPRSPRLAPILDNLGLAETRRGNLDRALELHTRALAIREEELGPDHIDVAGTLSNLALVHMGRDAFPVARDDFTRALTILDRHGLAETAQAAIIIDNLGLVAVALGDLDLAIQRHRSSLELRERLLGSEHIDVAPSLSNLGEAELRAGRHDDAIEHATAAIAIVEGKLGPEHFMLSYPLMVVAEAHIEQGRLAEAQPLAARALEIRERAAMPTKDIAAARALLERARTDD